MMITKLEGEGFSVYSRERQVTNNGGFSMTRMKRTSNQIEIKLEDAIGDCLQVDLDS